MRRISMNWKRVALGNALALTGLLAMALVAAPAMATPASFDNSGWGFEAAGLGSLPTGQFAGDLGDAGAPGTSSNLLVELSNSTDLCILASGSSACQATTAGIGGAYSVLVTVGVTVLDPSIDGPFTLLLTSVAPTAGYSPDEVQVELNPMAPSGLNTADVPGFSLGSFNPFVRIEDVTFAGSGVTYDYIGWNVSDGDSVTFRYEVLTSPDGRSTPQLTANVIPMTVVVPEPGTALLMGLGLAGLAASGRRFGQA
ncbi:MAG: PEP-CTERM sorting domain-containing protein [Myxococcota bacterium]